MTKPLIVDPSRLEIAGAKLGSLAMPAAPAAITAPGADAVSAAINETLPIIEAPVVEGLPTAKAALTLTGSKIATAANMYAETDQLLGARLDEVQFVASSSERRASGVASTAAAAGTQLAGALSGTDEAAAETAGALDNLETVVPQLSQVSGAASTVGTLTQSVVQGAQGAMGSAGSAPAQLADSNTKNDQPPSEQAELVDETKKQDEEGAAAGADASGAVPFGSQTSGRPETTPVQL
jgi:hypothetical protein